MAGKIIVGCRLPHGVVLRHPINQELQVEIQGLNKSKIIGATHISTNVDADFWAEWKAANQSSDLLKSNALFEAKSDSDAKAIAKEVNDEKTGFEKMPQKAPGIEKANDKDPE